MQEFLANETISCNLMSLTGYRTLVILYELMKSPKSIDELNDALYCNKYINENFSTDTLRIYVNSLREVGCEITRATKKNGNKFCLVSSPFDFKIKDSEIKYIKKILTAKDSIDIMTLLKIEDFIKKLSYYAVSEKTANALNKLLILSKIDISLIKSLIEYCNKKLQINILYKSPNIGNKEIVMVCDKLVIKNRRLYLSGLSITHNNYSTLSVERIEKILSVKIKEQKVQTNAIELICEIFDTEFYPSEEEEIINFNGKSFIVRITGQNEFFLMQKILYKGNKCKIISPNDFKQKFIEKINNIGKIYE